MTTNVCEIVTFPPKTSQLKPWFERGGRVNALMIDLGIKYVVHRIYIYDKILNFISCNMPNSIVIANSNSVVDGSYRVPEPSVSVIN